MTETTTLIGVVKLFREATTKKGKPYLQVCVNDIFGFYWGKPENLKGTFDVGDTVEFIYSTQGTFHTVLSVKKQKSETEKMVEKTQEGGHIPAIKEFMGDVAMSIDEVLDFLKTRGVPEAEGEKMIQSLMQIGEVFEVRHGTIQVLK